jgi:hypothetical protein
MSKRKWYRTGLSAIVQQRCKKGRKISLMVKADQALHY